MISNLCSVAIGRRRACLGQELTGMKEFVTSFSRFMLSMPVFGLQLMSDLLRPDDPPGRKGPAVRALDAVADSAVEQLDPSLRSAFRALDNVQRGVTSLAFSVLRTPNNVPGETARPPSERLHDSISLDAQRCGDGLSPARSQRDLRRVRCGSGCGRIDDRLPPGARRAVGHGARKGRGVRRRNSAVHGAFIFCAR